MVVGLGNPGRAYAGTRHNVGRRIAEAVQHELPSSVHVYWPETFMNVCGAPIAAAARKKGVSPGELLLITDDFELPLGTLRIRQKGSSGGHNGLQSVLEAFGTSVIPRLRVGIGPVPDGQDPADFVLKPFPASDRKQVGDVLVRGAEAVRTAVTEGVETAMNRYNQKANG